MTRIARQDNSLSIPRLRFGLLFPVRNAGYWTAHHFFLLAFNVAAEFFQFAGKTAGEDWEAAPGFGI